jgi:maltose alpha-D-glucosyltransferase/alpha-amylase
VANPDVRDELAQVMAFWIEQGLSGFRVDAVPFLIEPTGLPEGAIVDPHKLLRDLRSFLNRRHGEAVLLGEVNLSAADQRAFLGDEDGDELHMVFDFLGNQAMYLSLARGDAAPLIATLRDFPALPQAASLGRFVRNHDELTLDKLSDVERQEVFARFGPDPSLQLYGRGLRRRLPSMLDGDEAAMRMVYSLAFSLPGTPVLFYGEEIGMAENLDIDGRYSVRAPMQWSAERHGGFSTAPEDAELRRPLVQGRFGPEHVNVAVQRREPHSLLNWFERLIRRRRECPEIGFGELTVLDVEAPSVLAHRCDWEGSTIVAVHELAGRPAEVRLPVNDGVSLVELFDHAEHALPATLRLAP